MAKKLNKFSRSIAPGRGGEKFRRAGKLFDRAVIFYMVLVVAAVLVGMRGEYDLSSPGNSGFAVNFLMLPAYLPLLLIDGIACCFGHSILPKVGQEVFAFGVCDILLALCSWGGVRLAAARNQRVSILRTGRIFVLIMVVWGVFQLGCSVVRFACSKSSLSVKSSLIQDHK
jgi:hypothetical protein